MSRVYVTLKKLAGFPEPIRAQKKRAFLRLFIYLFYSLIENWFKSIKTIKAGSDNKSN